MPPKGLRSTSTGENQYALEMEPSATANAALARPRPEWLQIFGWTWAALFAVQVFEFAIRRVSGEWPYSMTGGPGDCLYFGDGVSDIMTGLAQLVAVFMIGRTGPKAFWTGIVTTEFIRFAPTAALIAWSSASPPPEFETLLRSALFWWPSRGIISVVAVIWLCMKHDRQSSLAVSLLASLTILGALSLLNREPSFNAALPWRTDSLLLMLAPRESRLIH